MTAELTAPQRVGFLRYTFPASVDAFTATGIQAKIDSATGKGAGLADADSLSFDGARGRAG